MSAAVRSRPSLYATAVGKKYAMAISGLVLMGYVLVHMIGNLKLFLGADDLNHYGEYLRELLVPILPRTITLWLLRIGLIAAFVLHIHAAYTLTRMNHRARPTDYSGPRTYLAANYASRTMRWSGVIVLLFVIFHLADLTWGIQPAAPDTWERGEVFANFVATFSRPGVVVFYVLANLALAPHIFHGAWSMFQSLGVNHPRFNVWRRYIAWALTAVIVVPNVIMPVAVLTGFVGG